MTHKGVVDGHFMRKYKPGGADLWMCDKCQYSTSKPEQAEEHEKSPR